MGIFKASDRGNNTPNIPSKSEEELMPANKDEHQKIENCFRIAAYFLAVICFLLVMISFVQTFYTFQIAAVFKSQMTEKEDRLKALTAKYDALNHSYTNLFHKYPALNQYCTTNDSSNLRKCSPCPEGWEPFKEKCYLFVPERKDWISSQYLCLSVGGHLAVVKNEEEQKFLWRKADDFSQGDSYWLGLTSMSGDWMWADDTPLEDEIQYWERSPTNWKSKSMCARLTPGDSHRFSWFPFSCKNSLKRICEKNQGTIV